MWRLAALGLVLALAPLVAAEPVAEESDYRRYVGVATQGSVDHGHEWLDAWMGPENWACSQATTDDVYVLRLLDGAPTDRLVLETRPAGVAPVHATATLGAPAVLEGYSSSLCHEFAVIGDSVASSAKYVVDVYHVPPWDVLCGLTC